MDKTIRAEPFQAQCQKPSALSERVQSLCQELPTPIDSIHGSPSKLSTADVMAAFARHGLLDLDFLEPMSSSLNARDLRQVSTILGCLAEHSGTLASIYMVNAALAPAVIVIEGTADQKHQLLPNVRSGTCLRTD